MIFVQKKSIFSKGLYWLIWWNMGRNWPLGVFKVFFKQNSTFTPILEHFWKKSKKIDFCDFFTCRTPKNGSVEYSTGPEYVVEYSEGLQTHQNSFRKKYHTYWTPLRYVEYILWFGQDYPKTHLHLQNYLSHLIKQIT